MSDAALIAPRVREVGPSTWLAEYGVAHEDGYQVTVGWSHEDEAWIAQVTGMHCGDVIGTGPSREQALLDCCCALGSVIDSFGPA
jgi:hypothetical protein